ncbi:MAG: hypothetical protein U5J78_05735 [Parasphingorhabdus sp.]|nr:hypothetical protein [Parasphingorhabdus sp.]
MTAIRLKTTVQAAGRALAANAERHLKPPAEMARLFAAAPDAIHQTKLFVDAIGFTLDDLSYEYPHEPVPPGWQPQAWLEHMVMEARARAIPADLPPEAQALIDEEFRLIGEPRLCLLFPDRP